MLDQPGTSRMCVIAQAKTAITAAKNVYRWGRYAAERYALNRGVPVRMLLAALKNEERRRIRNGVAA